MMDLSSYPTGPCRVSVLITQGTALDADQKIPLIKRQNKGTAYYCLPGGHCESESIAACCVREITEELGCACVPERVLGDFVNQAMGYTEVVVHATTDISTIDLSMVGSPEKSHEALSNGTSTWDVVLVSFNQAMQMIIPKETVTLLHQEVIGL
jgi:ADP-ribose pyrophosphatase YjhB (NUDIX family)